MWHVITCDETMSSTSLLQLKTTSFHLIKDEEANMVKAWELRGGEMQFLWPDTSVSVFSDDIIFLLSHISDTLLSQR